MILKARNESLELRIFRCLYARTNLSEKDENYFWNLEKGYNGELKFDTWFEQLSGDWIVLNDLLLECNSTLFQIDSLLITPDTIYLFEVKNYEGDFYIGSDSRWLTLSKNEIKNPLHQLNRCDSLFRRLLKHLGYNPSVETNLVFVNPDFYLYQAPLDIPIVFPSQINHYFKKIDSNLKSSKLNNHHLKLANQILSSCLDESPYTRLPEYNYEQLNKGISCISCHKLITNSQEKIVLCDNCGSVEDVDTAVLRSVAEFRTLFPNKKVTTSTIQDWCKIIKSKKTIRRILFNNFKLTGNARASFYVEVNTNRTEK